MPKIFSVPFSKDRNQIFGVNFYKKSNLNEFLRNFELKFRSRSNENGAKDFDVKVENSEKLRRIRNGESICEIQYPFASICVRLACSCFRMGPVCTIITIDSRIGELFSDLRSILSWLLRGFYCWIRSCDVQWLFRCRRWAATRNRWSENRIDPKGNEILK